LYYYADRSTSTPLLAPFGVRTVVMSMGYRRLTRCGSSVSLQFFQVFASSSHGVAFACCTRYSPTSQVKGSSRSTLGLMLGIIRLFSIRQDALPIPRLLNTIEGERRRPVVGVVKVVPPYTPWSSSCVCRKMTMSSNEIVCMIRR
jgi:hypothetical protein